jgi:DNA-directed RNA polymerase specialized sigma24 family protein
MRTRKGSVITIRSDALDLVPEEKLHSAFDRLRGMPLRDATMLIQSCLLGASYQDIADYHGLHKSKVTRIFKELRKRRGG